MSQLATVQAWEVSTATGVWPAAMSMMHNGSEIPVAQGQVIVGDAPAPEDPPVAAKMGVGACPANPGGESLNAALSVANKYADGVVVRQFMGSIKTPNVSPRLSTVHTSYNLASNPYDQVLAGNLDAAITAAALAARPGDILEWTHEFDKKVRDGNVPLAGGIQAKNHFYDVVKAANPEVLVATTYTWGLFASWHNNNLDTPDDYKDIKADILGIDYDGGVTYNTSTGYPNFTDTMNRVRTWATGKYSRLAVPEFGCPRSDTLDTDGAILASWLQQSLTRFASYGYEYVCYYDYNLNSDYSSLDKPASIAVWRDAVIASNAD